MNLLWDIRDALIYFLGILLSIYGHEYVFQSFQPSKLNIYNIDLNGHEYYLEVPLRLVRMMNVIYCLLIVTFYDFGLASVQILYLGRILVSSFFIWDCIAVYRYEKEAKLAKVCHSDGSPKIATQQFISVLIHHAITFVAIHGMNMNSRTIVLIAYLRGDYALLPLNISWFLVRFPWLKIYQTQTRVYILEVVTWLLYSTHRIVNFLAVGIYLIVYELDWSSNYFTLFGSAFQMFCFVNVYIMNIKWWLILTQRTFKLSEEVCNLNYLTRLVVSNLNVQIIPKHNHNHRTDSNSNSKSSTPVKSVYIRYDDSQSS
jgi:hypothetical protein